MVTKQIAIVAGVLAAIVSASASADQFNVRPVSNAATLSGLQTLLDTNTTGGLNAVSDQSEAAIWQRAEADSAAYLVSLVSGAGTLGIYSYATGAQYSLGVGAASDVGSFKINSSGALKVNNVDVDASFGQLFGFYFGNNPADTVYTEDSKNAGAAKALSYLIADGTYVTVKDGATTDSFQLLGNNDWIVAFENTGATSFTDGVFAIEDIKVPEPTSIALMALGLVGVTMVARRRSNKGVSLQFA